MEHRPAYRPPASPFYFPYSTSVGNEPVCPTPTLDCEAHPGGTARLSVERLTEHLALISLQLMFVEGLIATTHLRHR